jgi:ABC-2 type transport system ATP-binding protein
VRECVSLYAGYYAAGLPVAEIIDLVGLSESAEVRGGRLSGGQRRRLEVALALVGDPELLFLDEPTTGFDPSARRAAWDMITGLQGLGKTIFLTTHYMDEAEYLADRICVLAAGQIVGMGTPDTLGGRDSAPAEITFTVPAGVTPPDLPGTSPRPIRDGAGGGRPAAESPQTTGRRIELQTDSPMDALGALAAWGLQQGHTLADIEVHRPTLEEIYLKLTEAAP